MVLGGMVPGGMVLGDMVWGCVPDPGVVVVVFQHALRHTPSVHRMTNRCKNITLLQTSFVSSKYDQMTRIYTHTKIYPLYCLPMLSSHCLSVLPTTPISLIQIV